MHLTLTEMIMVEFQSSLIHVHVLGQWTSDVKKNSSIPLVQVKTMLRNCSKDARHRQISV